MLPDHDQLRSTLAAYITDSDSREAAAAAIARMWQTATVDGAVLDLGRQARCGFPEVIYGEGKSATLIIEILKRQAAAGQAGFVTRVNPDVAAKIQAAFPDSRYNEIARTIRLSDSEQFAKSPAAASPPVVVITAGSTDLPVAEEAVETLRWMNVACELIQDVGVAGPQRLLQQVDRLRDLAAVVVVAGMEAALPSVVGGFVNCPVIGVPTSVGYGASLNGITAMLSMLTCCASNVVTVNIDAGFRGGYVAGMIAKGQSTATQVMGKANGFPRSAAASDTR
ncbi:MAG: nickel pincer cofactor biosynthesis protein LarB [Planctomycetaceae bacterium]